MKKIKVWHVSDMFPRWEWRVIWETRETTEVLAQGCVEIDHVCDILEAYNAACKAALKDFSEK